MHEALLRSYDGVIAAASRHVNVHETGAIEHSGHKVLALAHTDGKLSAEMVRDYLQTFYADGNYTHMVFPGAMYISHPTEYGALLAKCQLLGVQFDTLFTDGLYQEISRNAIETADRIRAALVEKGYQLFCSNPTNQIFLVLENEQIKWLEEHVALGFMEKFDDAHTVMRICTPGQRASRMWTR